MKATEWEKMHTIHVIGKELIYDTYNEFLPIYKRNTDHLQKRGHPNDQ